MGVIDTYIPEKELDLEYNSAKIIASPYDYKLSERIFFKDFTDCYERYNIFGKGYGTEKYLCEKLKLGQVPYLNPYDKIINSTTFKTDLVCDAAHDILRPLENPLGFIGTFIKYNNLIINDIPLINDIGHHYFKLFGRPLNDKAVVGYIKREGLLKGIEVLFTKCTLADSLIPNLMYLATEFHDKSLNEMENIEFAKERISAKESPLIKSLYYGEEYDEFIREWLGRLISTAVVPIYTKYDMPATGYLSSHSDVINFSSSLDLGVALYNLGACYCIIYGCELLYHFDNIHDPVIRDSLEKILSMGYDAKSFCAKYLYTIDDMGHVVMNSEVLNCFHPDNETRFIYIRDYFDKLLKDMSAGPAVISALEYYKFPTIFGRLVMSLHNYAFQVARIKHATLLYTEAKNQGLIDKDELTDTIDADADDEGSLFSLPGAGAGSDDETDNELLDLSTFETSGDKSLSDDSLIEKEKTVTKKEKEKGPMLNAADMLKKDLHDSKYSFDINYVKNSPSNKDSYNAIANNISMITHELTRQIKEIKTYNTGGKQGGLLVGKLDKKNLWKYKTDPHIFYNNNYKIKEMDLAFGCILDESGSMHGEKIKNGRIVMVMLHEVLNSLGINHSIIGHTSEHMYQSTIYKYFQFKEESHYSLDKPYGLVSADNRNGNCDSGALYYMQSVMKSVKNKDKIVIIFSDGQPTECTDLDLTEQVKDMERNGIHVIGVGINFNSIKEYYPDNANGKNLKEMVDIVISILKRYVLEKKED